jgi:hypothetical protein
MNARPFLSTTPTAEPSAVKSTAGFWPGAWFPLLFSQRLSTACAPGALIVPTTCCCPSPAIDLRRALELEADVGTHRVASLREVRALGRGCHAGCRQRAHADEHHDERSYPGQSVAWTAEAGTNGRVRPPPSASADATASRATVSPSARRSIGAGDRRTHASAGDCGDAAEPARGPRRSAWLSGCLTAAGQAAQIDPSLGREGNGQRGPPGTGVRQPFGIPEGTVAPGFPLGPSWGWDRPQLATTSLTPGD